MTPFEDLIRALGKEMDITLEPDAHQSCLLTFPKENLSIQIDLDTSADQILIGSQLGEVPPGAYRERVFTQAMRVNGASTTPRGILAYSEMNGTLILFQFLSLAALDGSKLNGFVQLFREHAKAWKEALGQGELPSLEEDVQPPGDPMFGLKR
ncbi:MAG: hypothetical protein S4CHLAM2_00020 [Chlamydiales bacterium]|nr:hypothetical protein [Chlamydiales bacterium]